MSNNVAGRLDKADEMQGVDAEALSLIAQSKLEDIRLSQEKEALGNSR